MTFLLFFQAAPTRFPPKTEDQHNKVTNLSLFCGICGLLRRPPVRGKSRITGFKRRRTVEKLRRFTERPAPHRQNAEGVECLSMSRIAFECPSVLLLRLRLSPLVLEKQAEIEVKIRVIRSQSESTAVVLLRLPCPTGQNGAEIAEVHVRVGIQRIGGKHLPESPFRPDGVPLRHGLSLIHI